MNNDFEEGLFDRLVGTGTDLFTLVSTKIFNMIAPTDAALPYVIFSRVGGGENHDTPGDSGEFIYMVKGVSATHLQAGAIRDAIRDRIHRVDFAVATWSLSGGGLAEESVGLLEIVDGRDYYHAGNNYRFWMSK